MSYFPKSAGGGVPKEKLVTSFWKNTANHLIDAYTATPTRPFYDASATATLDENPHTFHASNTVSTTVPGTVFLLGYTMTRAGVSSGENRFVCTPPSGLPGLMFFGPETSGVWITRDLTEWSPTHCISTVGGGVADGRSYGPVIFKLRD